MMVTLAPPRAATCPNSKEMYPPPTLASVGLLESVARRWDLAFDVHRGDTASWYSSRRVGETHSGFKVLVEKPSGHILGAHVLGPHGDDVLNLFAMAMRTGATASSLKEILFAYPTAGSDIIEIFSAGCSTCKETIEMVQKVAGAEHHVQVSDMQHGDTAARAKELGVRSLPAVVINGKLAGCCAGGGPDEHVIRQALQ